jgi:hypothetical protein
MQFSKTTLLLIFMGILPFNFSCINKCRLQNCGTVTSQRLFNIVEMQLEYINLNSNKIIDSSQTHSIDSIGLRLFVSKFHFTTAILNSNGFANYMMANSPKSPQSEESLLYLKIYSTTKQHYMNLNDTVFENEDISKRFQMSIDYSYKKFKEIDQIVNNNLHLSMDEYYSLKLKNKPQVPTTFRFRLELIMSNGKRFVFRESTLHVK